MPLQTAIAVEKLKGGLPVKQYYRNWYEGRKNIYRERHLRKTWGMSLEDLFQMMEDQDNLCAVCEVDLTTLIPKNIHVDHCHISGKVRGVLCNNCNMALGLLKDNTDTLKSAIKYLEAN